MSHTKKKKKCSDEPTQFEFCEVCRLNHNQGRRHNFFPSHKSSLAALLARFRSKLSDVKFFLKTPMPLRPEHAHRNSMWCVFCNCDIAENDSAFSCGNAIKHLATEDHWKRLKEFMWKYGGGMDKVDLFRIAEADYAKWEKKCNSLKTESVKTESVGPSKDIHNEMNAENVNSFHKNSIDSFKLYIANDVVPLHSSTDERIQVSTSSLPMAGGPFLGNMSSAIQAGNASCLNSTGYMGNHHLFNHDSSILSGERIANGENTSSGLLNLTQISYQNPNVGNVHTGAPPPWFDTTQGSQPYHSGKPELDSLVSSKARKSSKLNPKRVGAAWAERRKLEMEMERRGELVGNNFDANWLPNFGRVWQSGTRKESRKEFRMENKPSVKAESQSETPIPLQPYVNKPSVKAESQSETPIPLQPYVSKRMRKDTSSK